MDEELIDDCRGRKNAIVSLEAKVAMYGARWEISSPPKHLFRLCCGGCTAGARFVIEEGGRHMGIPFDAFPIRKDSMSERSLRYPNITCSTQFRHNS